MRTSRRVELGHLEVLEQLLRIVHSTSASALSPASASASVSDVTAPISSGGVGLGRSLPLWCAVVRAALDFSHGSFLGYCEHRRELLGTGMLATVRTRADDTEAEGEAGVEEAFVRVTIVDHNRAVVGTAAAADDIWAAFAAHLLTRCPRLTQLDLSHCAQSLTQATRLLDGLVYAIKCRHRLGLPPLDKLLLRGMDKSSVALKNFCLDLNTLRYDEVQYASGADERPKNEEVKKNIISSSFSRSI
ncbi:hypothetical protein B484DRAFT_410161 [Ochromonadaceae sp. CCMP2298]|nr:hypothetical protein B484DRAFT_410161 [Ochromonadaceae sp. CCMP2298]